FRDFPLPGSDVPFHSGYLWAGAMPFRTREKSILPTPIPTSSSENTYMPNLVAQPFHVSRGYAQRIYD
ncbi:hypothetical protein M407DRAFT_57273, partial [Tulasnella calospora MUT 4182]